MASNYKIDAICVFSAADSHKRLIQNHFNQVNLNQFL